MNLFRFLVPSTDSRAKTTLFPSYFYRKLFFTYSFISSNGFTYYLLQYLSLFLCYLSNSYCCSIWLNVYQFMIPLYYLYKHCTVKLFYFSMMLNVFSKFLVNNTLISKFSHRTSIQTISHTTTLAFCMFIFTSYQFLFPYCFYLIQWLF